MFHLKGGVMNKKRYIISVLAVFVLFVVTGWVLHGVLLKDIYSSTQHFWRPQDSISSLTHLVYVGTFFFSLLFCFIYTKGLESQGCIIEGLRYGIIMALFIHIPMSFVRFVYLPYPTKLHVYWLVGGVVEVILAGIVLGLIYRKPAA